MKETVHSEEGEAGRQKCGTLIDVVYSFGLNGMQSKNSGGSERKRALQPRRKVPGFAPENKPGKEKEREYIREVQEQVDQVVTER